MSLELKSLFESCSNDYSQESLVRFSQNFHSQFSTLNYGEGKFSRYVPNLFFDFFNSQEFSSISERILNETQSPNLNFSTLLFRLSLELNSDKTNLEKELIYSLVFNIISKNEQIFNDITHYSIGFVASQAANMGLDISPTIFTINKLNTKHNPYLEEGFIDALSSNYSHILENTKLFNLFLSKYDSWAVSSQEMLKKMYTDFIPAVPQEKHFNPVNSQSFFWMNTLFTNDSLKKYLKEYCEKSFTTQLAPLNTNVALEKNYFNLKNELKIEKQNNQKLFHFIDIMKEHFEPLKEVNPLLEKSITILNQTFKDQSSYITSLEQYQIDNDHSKKLKEGIKRVL